MSYNDNWQKERTQKNDLGYFLDIFVSLIKALHQQGIVSH